MKQTISREEIVKIHDHLFEIPQSYRSDMLVPAQIFVNEKMLDEIIEDKSLWQIVNVATLPGIQKAAMAMPDVHQGYGFPIGGVAAMAIHDGGVISPGGIGYDINCGVRLLASNLTKDESGTNIERVAQALFDAVPSGVGIGGKVKLAPKAIELVLADGAKRMVAMGIGNENDLACCEENGHLQGANPELVSSRAKERGHDQLGTLGSGNHFLEIQYVDEIFDEKVASAFGLQKGTVTVMIHCGSRGLGHQVCTDYVQTMVAKAPEWGIQLVDRELSCAPFFSKEGQDYFAAMTAAANFAWANRHTIGHHVRKAWQGVLGKTATLSTVYDVAHNIGKREIHEIGGKPVEVIMHRKGATRAFPASRQETPEHYKNVGHPVLIPGTMGTASYVLVGTEKGMIQSFGSTCHGAGRSMSRRKAKQSIQGSQLRKQLEEKGITICCSSDRGLSEEAPLAYKDIHNVIDVVEGAGLARKVAALKPLAVIKGN